MKNVQLLIIDPQNDFAAKGRGALFVEGADQDSIRTAEMIRRLGRRVERISVTLDSHHIIDIAHPIFWQDTDGKPLEPFTIVSVNDIEAGKYRTRHPGLMKRASDYVRKLAENGRYPLCIWPEHCIIGGWGHNIVEPIKEALEEWERDKFAMVDLVTKGSSPWTEHYSAVRADVPDPSDPTTQINKRLIDTLQEADVIGVMGQALSHCLANTIRDVADEFGEDSIQKLVLIEDCTSSVPGFEQLGTDFIREMTARGMKTSKAADFLA